MSGLKLKLPTSFTDTSLPTLKLDPLLNSGSLILIEPAHTANPFAGVPTNGAILPNLARDEFTDLTGVTGETVDGKFVQGTGWIDGTTGRIERTARGGLHGISTQGELVSNANAYIDLPTAFRSYVVDHQSNDYYVSAWQRYTRKEGATYPLYGLIGSSTGSAGPHLTSWQQSSRPDGSHANLLGHRTPSASFLEPYRRAIAVKQVTGSESLATIRAHFGWGRLPVATSSNGYPSWIIYRLYVEDLTVSGRTWEEVDAADAALHAAAFGAGGRYEADSFTAPSSVVA